VIPPLSYAKTLMIWPTRPQRKLFPPRHPAASRLRYQGGAPPRPLYSLLASPAFKDHIDAAAAARLRADRDKAI
jgi:hypothetical protein